jgi:membrane protein implicated in regulation of membrane protease activity
MFGHAPSATASVTVVAPGLVTSRFLLFAITSVITAAVTRHFTDIVYTHAASE